MRSLFHSAGRLGPIQTQTLGLYYSLSPKVLTAKGYAVKVFTDDHGPPHVHVLKDGMLLKIALDPVAFVSAKYGRPSGHVRHEALIIVQEHVEACWAVWRRIYGEDAFR